MSIAEQLVGKTARERAEIKASHLAALLPETFTRGPWSLTIVDGPHIRAYAGVPMLSLVVSVTRNGQPVPIDGDLRFYNPPVMVPDGTTRTVQDDFGNDIVLNNFVEAPRLALRQIIVDALIGQLQ